MGVERDTEPQSLVSASAVNPYRPTLPVAGSSEQHLW
jgi:hypothetical protein